MAPIALAVKRKNGETWRQAVERQAGRYGLKRECIEAFDHNLKNGKEESQAAWDALYDWDCLELINRS